MSTEHTGGYCAQKDKMMLTREAAQATVRRMKGMISYRCGHCGHWHMAHQLKSGGKKRMAWGSAKAARNKRKRS